MLSIYICFHLCLCNFGFTSLQVLVEHFTFLSEVKHLNPFQAYMSGLYFMNISAIAAAVDCVYFILFFFFFSLKIISLLFGWLKIYVIV